MSRMEMSEKTATEMAYTVKEVIEEGFRWLLRVGAERDLFAFGLTIGSLWLLSFIAGRFDLPAFLFTGNFNFNYEVIGVVILIFGGNLKNTPVL